MAGFIRRWLRRRMARQPLPRQWLAILSARVPFFRLLAGGLRDRFLELLKIFVAEKTFVGGGGLEITDEMRVVIAACAVRLVLHRDLDAYDRLSEIVVYPYVYRHPGEDGAVLGEAHAWGVVVLSWPAVLQGLADSRDGLETAGHEFAHVLDRADGAFDGTPELDRRQLYRPWAEVMSHHFLRLAARQKTERKVLRAYGATNEAEFFAVATESYFEKPQQMQQQTPELYDLMRTFYGGDAAAERAANPEADRPLPKVGRNDPCPCGSGRKHKRCCGHAG